MKRQPKKIDFASVQFATSIAIDIKNSTINYALQMVSDRDYKARIEACKCAVCFYRDGRMGGAAITVQPCGICLTEVSYSSTATDVLCKECASKHTLCKQCGSDMHLRPRRIFEP